MFDSFKWNKSLDWIEEKGPFCLITCTSVVVHVVLIYSRDYVHRLLYSGVVLALKVPQLCLRKQNLELVLHSLNTLYTLHQTQPTIQVQYNCTFRCSTLALSGTVHLRMQVQYTCTFRCNTLVHSGAVHLYIQVQYTCIFRCSTLLHSGALIISLRNLTKNQINF